MPRTTVAPGTLLVVTLLTVATSAGCLELAPSGSTETHATTIAPVVTTHTSTDRTTGMATRDAPAYGTQFVSVARYENQSIGENWAADQRSTFENLTAAQQDAFRRALDEGQIVFGPDEDNPFDYHDDRPRVVTYDGSWFYVRVSIV